jgi:thymidylate synthase (FAD)
MRIIQPSFEILTPLEWFDDQIKILEVAGRTCYKSEDRITEESAPEFVGRIANVVKHESVIEHSIITVKFVCDRGVSHEMVRHRVASYSQESTRYCNYSKDKFDNEISVICPPGLAPFSEEYGAWVIACRSAEQSYMTMLKAGCKPQIARSVLPTCLKTEVVMSANFREWRHVFALRCAENAHPQIRELMIPLRDFLAQRLPCLFATQTFETPNRP